MEEGDLDWKLILHEELQHTSIRIISLQLQNRELSETLLMYMFGVI